MQVRFNLLGRVPLLCVRGRHAPRAEGSRHCPGCLERAREYARKRRMDPTARAALNEERRARYADDPAFRESLRDFARQESRRRYHHERGYREAQEARQKALRGNPQTWAESVMRGMRNRAKAKGLEFSIAVADVPMTLVCPVFGTTLRYGGPVAHPDSPSVDRIDNRRGYVPGNIWVISRRANTLKNNATLDELETLVAALRKLGGAA